ncbi:iron complex outermembrane receptor protein [Sphingomonas endophytica]|uniref:Iron complex outermembrane receptor protein n=1 Tax=Sphingomonas endophytica TaxID=869719 RepID=A0A7X0MLA8_9SPHN|nr:TonB-dependent receptor [Sphingomonas endophytica]MBB6503447.1 iron complex outermembrane receptor protein [Sphingomonas endophytica]
MRRSSKSILLAGLAAGVALSTLPAAAQTGSTAPAATDAAPDADDTGLGEVVVTAERRTENLRRVPVSVAVVNGDDLRTFQAGGEDALALAGRVPGLYAETTTGRIFPRFYIRGLGNIDFYLGASQPVSIIQDDVVLEHVVLKSNPVYDVANVEVLRGPQGSLFGRNTTAGIIKFDTIRPGQTWSSRFNASYGSYNTVTFDAGVGGPLVQDKIAVRLSGLYQHRDDWVDNDYTGVSRDGTRPGRDAMGGFDERDARLQVLLTPTETLSINLSGHVRSYEGTSTVFHRGALIKGQNNINLEPRDRVALDEGANNPQAYKTYGGSVNAAWDFGAATLTSITAYETTSGYSRGDTDGGAATNFGGSGYGESLGRIRDLDQWTQEVRLASNGDGAFKWQFGGFYFDSRDVTEFYQRGYFLLPGDAQRNVNNWVRLRNVNTSWAVFGQASYRLAERLTLTAGARYTEDDKETRLVRAGRNAAGTLDTFPATAPRAVKLTGKEPSWDLSALYEIDPTASIYARVARGFRGPTIQGRSAVFNTPFSTADSETIMSYEAGVKTQPTSKLRLNATAFTYRVNDIQLNGNDANGNGTLFNADHANAYGVEAEMDWRPIRNITFSLGGSAIHTEIKDKNVFAQVCQFGPSVTCTVLNQTVPATIFGQPATLARIDGNPLPNAPRWQVDAAVRYDIPLSDRGNFFVASDVNMQGYTNFVLYKTREFFANDNLELGLKAGFSTADGRYEIAAFARNITNEKNLKGVIENYNAAVFNEPRIVGVSLSGKFD